MKGHRISFSDGAIHESDGEKKGIIFDYTADGQIAGIEALNASKRVGNPSKVEYEVAL